MLTSRTRTVSFVQTQYEAWLAFRIVTSTGFSAVSHERRAELGRAYIVTVYEAPKALEQALEEEWGDIDDIQEAHAKLASPDVIVTNQKDKDVQLEKMFVFDQRARAQASNSGSGNPVQARQEGEYERRRGLAGFSVRVAV